MKELKIYNPEGILLVCQLLDLKGKDVNINYEHPISESISMITIIECKEIKKKSILKRKDKLFKRFVNGKAS